MNISTNALQKLLSALNEITEWGGKGKMDVLRSEAIASYLGEVRISFLRPVQSVDDAIIINNAGWKTKAICARNNF